MPEKVASEAESTLMHMLLHASPYCSVHAVTGVFRWLVGLGKTLSLMIGVF